MGQSVSKVAGHAREAIEEAVEHGRGHARHYYDQAAKQARHLKDMGVEQVEHLRGHVQHHAIASTLIAFASGFLIARFLFRR